MAIGERYLLCQRALELPVDAGRIMAPKDKVTIFETNTCSVRVNRLPRGLLTKNKGFKSPRTGSRPRSTDQRRCFAGKYPKYDK